MFEREKRSKIWKSPISEFKKVVGDSSSFGEILKRLDCRPSGGSYWAIKERCEELNIDISHIPLGVGSNKGRRLDRSYPSQLEKVMVVNSTYGRKNLKRRLLKSGILKEVCDDCGIGTEWNGKKLVIQMDHKNGIGNDNRRENLRMLCPNCHSQTHNFAGRNARKNKT